MEKQREESLSSLVSLDVPVEQVYGDCERQFWCEFNPESEEPTLAMASADAQVKVWTFENDVKQPACRHICTAGTEPVLRVTWYPGAGSNLVGKEPFPTVKEESSIFLKVSRYIVAGDASGEIYLWNLEQEKKLDSFGSKDSTEQVYALRYVCQLAK